MALEGPARAGNRSNCVMRTKLLAIAAIGAIICLGVFGYVSHVNKRLDSNDPLQVLNGYLAAKIWQDRLALVRNPGQVGPLMEKQYSGSPLQVPAHTVVERIDAKTGPRM